MLQHNHNYNTMQWTEFFILWAGDRCRWMKWWFWRRPRSWQRDGSALRLIGIILWWSSADGADYDDDGDGCCYYYHEDRGDLTQLSIGIHHSVEVNIGKKELDWWLNTMLCDVGKLVWEIWNFNCKSGWRRWRKWPCNTISVRACCWSDRLYCSDLPSPPCVNQQKGC